MDASAPYQPRSQTRNDALAIRAALRSDEDALWAILEPIIRAGETYPLPRDMSKAGALAYWGSPRHEVFVAERDGAILGSYYLRANQDAGGTWRIAATWSLRMPQVAALAAPCALIPSNAPARADFAPCNSISSSQAMSARRGYGRIAVLLS
jgi:hypothetical protein